MRSLATMDRGLTVAEIVRHVAFEFDRPVAEIIGERRLRRLTWARYAAAWLARRHTGKTLVQIGRVLGRRDHSSVHHQVKRAGELRESDGYFREITDRLDQLMVAA